jgi:Flp pilus assembly protein protease CpaA
MRKLFLLLYLVVLSVFDGREKKVPIVLLCGGTAIAAAVNLYICIRDAADWKMGVMTAFMGMLPGCFLLLVARVTGKAGYGDGIALLGVGLLTGYGTCLLLLCFSLLCMSVCSIVLLLTRKAEKNTTLPYLPFLAAVYLVGMFV